MNTPEVEAQNLTRFCNEALILSALRDGPLHGYQLVLDIEQRSDGFFRFNHGTLYPILHKLEKEGKISGSWSPEATGRKRKSYTLTDDGQRYVEELLASWAEFQRRFDSTTGGGA